MAFAKRPSFDWQLRARSLTLGERTRIMAIVNLTPDSFSGDGLAASFDAGMAVALAALGGGADILDLGAESTRPNATPISADEEQARLLPVLEAVLHERPDAVVSADTYHAATARAAAAAGAEIINDVSGLLWDPGMAEAVAATGCGLVLMHTRGRPRDWPSQLPLASGTVVSSVVNDLRERLAAAFSAGIPAGKIVLDPGFGFGKLGAANFELLAGLQGMQCLSRPLLIGLSRKGFLGEAVRSVQPEQNVSAPEARRTATIAANIAAVMAGAHILRVHDVQASREAAAIADAVLAAGRPQP